MSDVNPKKKLEQLGKKIVDDIIGGKSPKVDVPIRALSNVKFNEKTKTLELGNKSSERAFFNVGHVKKFSQTIEVAKVSHQLLTLDKHASLRDVFYMAKRTLPGTDTNLVDEQTESDKAIEDLEVISDLSREQLNINADKKGSVVGNVVIEDMGDAIDWSKLGSGGWSIPSNVEDIKIKKVNADFVLYMEKAAVWERLNEDKFWKKYNCILVASAGQTTRGIRRLLQRFYEEFKLPIYVLCDGDIYGIYIYSVIKYGSISLAHAAERLTIPSVRYLGITMDDIEKYDLKKHFIKLRENDYDRIKQVSEYDWFKDNKAWQRQFKMMKTYNAKVEIQSLSSKGISFISDVYLPEKIKNKEFLD